MKILHKYLPINNPLALGFLISLMGALPLGYINVIGLQIMLQKGIWATSSFIFGVIFIEFIVLKAVSFGAKRIVQHKKLLYFIDIFTILFFLSIAYYFYSNIGNEKNFNMEQIYLAQFPFFLGLLLNSLNFIQWPYWSGIYLFLYKTEKLKSKSNFNAVFIIGVLIGNFTGIMLFALTGNYFLSEDKAEIGKYLNIIFTILFLVLAFYQLYNFFWRTKKNNFNPKQKTIKIASQKL